MEAKYQTSFIPKKPVTTGQSSSSGGGVSLLLLISIIVFLITLGSVAYVILFKQAYIKTIEQEQQTIETNKNGLVSDSLTIESLVELDSRINVANKLLKSHVVVSPIFSFLQQATLKNVRFKNFSFTSSNKDSSNKVAIQMSGQAKDWETVALQADEFGKTEWKKIVSEPKVSNLSLNSDGSISFIFSAYINPDYLVYSNNI